jgi:hypothetical protein
MSIRDFKEPGIARRPQACQVNFSSQKLFKIFLKREPLIGDRWAVVGDKLDEQIHVALRWVKIFARSRAEELKPLNLMLAAKRFDLASMLPDEVHHAQTLY